MPSWKAGTSAARSSPLFEYEEAIQAFFAELGIPVDVLSAIILPQGWKGSKRIRLSALGLVERARRNVVIPLRRDGGLVAHEGLHVVVQLGLFALAQKSAGFQDFGVPAPSCGGFQAAVLSTADPIFLSWIKWAR